MSGQSENEWHLERKVTLSIIVALLLNAGSSIWWASKLDYTVQEQSARITNVEKSISEQRERNNNLYERLARIEANQSFQNETLREIKDSIKK